MSSLYVVVADAFEKLKRKKNSSNNKTSVSSYGELRKKNETYSLGWSNWFALKTSAQSVEFSGWLAMKLDSIREISSNFRLLLRYEPVY